MSQKKSITVIWEYFLLFALMIPPIFEFLPNASSIYVFINAIKVFIGVYLIIKAVSCKVIGKFELIYFVISFWALLSTLINSGSITAYAQFVITSLSTVLWVKIYVSNEDGFAILYKYLAVVSIVNLAMMLIWPEGLVVGVFDSSTLPIWLLGTSNFATPSLLLSTIICGIEWLTNHSCLSLVGIISSIVSIYMGTAVTGMVGAAVFIIPFIIVTIFKPKSLYSPTYLLLILTIISFVIVIFGKRIDNFGFFIEGILGKDLTFSGRSSVWELAINYIRQSPIWGYGLQSNDNIISMISHSHCHDYYLNFAFESGLVGLALWLTSLMMAIRKLNHTKGNTISALLAFGLFSFMVALLTESYNNRYLSPFYFILSLCVISDELINQSQLCRKQ